MRLELAHATPTTARTTATTTIACQIRFKGTIKNTRTSKTRDHHDRAILAGTSGRDHPFDQRHGNIRRGSSAGEHLRWDIRHPCMQRHAKAGSSPQGHPRGNVRAGSSMRPTAWEHPPGIIRKGTSAMEHPSAKRTRASKSGIITTGPSSREHPGGIVQATIGMGTSAGDRPQGNVCDGTSAT